MYVLRMSVRTAPIRLMSFALSPGGAGPPIGSTAPPYESYAFTGAVIPVEAEDQPTADG